MFNLHNFINSKSKIFDYKIGLTGGSVMAIVVFIINYRATGETTGALTAAAKQGIYTFFFGGIIMKICELLAININYKYLALFLATLIPSIIALALTFGVHSLRGTPLPVESTIPTAIFVFPSTAIWGILKRRIYMKNNPEPPK